MASKRSTVSVRCTAVCSIVLVSALWCVSGQEFSEVGAVEPRQPKRVELLTEAPPEDATVKDFEEELNSVLGGLLAKALPAASKFLGSEYLTPRCTSALLKTSLALRNKDAWALRLSTSSGGIPANLFEGGTASLGSFQQCVNARAHDPAGREDFKGMYCSLYLQPPESFTQRMTARLNAIGQWEGRKNQSAWNKHPRGHFAGYRIGLCAPSACEEEEIDYVVQLSLEDYGANTTVRRCVTDDPQPILLLHILIFVFIAVSVGTVFLGTCLELYDINYRIKYPEKPILALPARMLLCFSCIRNLKKLTSTRVEKQSLEESLQFICGIKVAMTLWVILGNAYLTTQWDTFDNGNAAIDLPRTVPFQLAASSFLAPSTFFFISGFLVCYIAMVNSETVYGRNYLGLYAVMVIRRYIRLTVPAVPVLLYFFLFPLFISGPMAKDLMDREVSGCYKNWWSVLGHAVNYVPYEERCLSHLWYISNDMQLFLLGGAVAIMCVRSVLWAATLVFAIGTLGPYAAGYMTDSLNLFAGATVAPDDINRSIRTLDWAFTMPYSNAGPYLAGATCAYMSASWPNIKFTRPVEIVFWMCSMGCNLVLVFMPLLWNLSDDPKRYRLLEAFYGGGHRLVWGISWSWVFYACVTGRAGLVKRALSWKGFLVPARLTFGVYLVHYLVYVARTGVSTTTLQLNEFLQVKDALGVAVISYFLALLLYLQYEAPMMNGLKLASDFISYTYEEFKKSRAAKRKEKEIIEDTIMGPTIVHFPDPNDPGLEMIKMASRSNSRQSSLAGSFCSLGIGESAVLPGTSDVDIDIDELDKADKVQEHL
ncbi:O-acyltransferase like protein-like [Ornithodoros turicata]|uniref:O-acyltransferase like protein-like n=1 Tax=Ornithodoros turicata TaxID=34597 RepID=UPI003139C050